jgi:two-component system phosphate regulon sensor histidine kinase PhoR
VHQLLREYRILGAVLGTFVHEQVDKLAVSSSSGDVFTVVNRLNEAVFVLLQTTVDTFVSRYTAMIEEQTMRLDGFNRMVSHELRQPLSSVQFALELLRGPALEDPEKREHFLDVADRNIRRLAHLLGMLGALARPDQPNLQLQEVDLAKLVGEVLRQLRDAAHTNGVSLESQLSPGSFCLVDVPRLELVLVNLVSNGIKYRDPAKPAPFVEVTLVDAEGRCQLRVRDNGLGIRTEDQSGIFRRFFRAHASRDAELGNDGIGLGLAIAAECVKAMRGTLAFESTEGVGTAFIVTLPKEPGSGATT